jgi:hypothetical protein
MPWRPCSYRIKSDSPVTDEWILQHVVPSIAHSAYGPTLGKLLGKALLWVIFSEKSAWVPFTIVEQVKQAYNNLLGEESSVNPIEKKLLVLAGDNATLIIQEVIPISVDDLQQGEQGQQQQQFEFPAGGHFESWTSRQLIHNMAHQISGLQAAVFDLAEARQADKAAMMAAMMTQFGIVNTNLRRVAAQPIRQLHQAAAAAQPNNNNQNGGGNQNAGGGGVASPLVRAAELSPTPRSVYILWEEYMNGIIGRKAARLFSAEERGRVKHKYCRRKVVWDLISRLVNAGLSAQVACDRIVAVYGDSTPVTRIIDQLKVDIRSKRLHPT